MFAGLRLMDPPIEFQKINQRNQTIGGCCLRTRPLGSKKNQSLILANQKSSGVPGQSKIKEKIFQKTQIRNFKKLIFSFYFLSSPTGKTQLPIKFICKKTMSNQNSPNPIQFRPIAPRPFAIASTIPTSVPNCPISANPLNTSHSNNPTVTTPTSRNIQYSRKNWFLTFPLCNTTKEEAMERILASTLFKARAVVIAQEHHQDGQAHLHIGLFLADKMRTRDPHLFDFIAGKHGNYQAMASISGTIKYLHKEDKNPLIYGDIENISTRSSTSKSSDVANLILSGGNLSAVNDLDPGFLLFHKRKVEDYMSFVSLENLRKQFVKLCLPVKYNGTDGPTKSIVDWLNTALNALPAKRPLKSPQLWIHGPPNSLKSSLVAALSKYLRVYYVPMQEDFYDLYDNNTYDMAVFEEFYCSKTLQFMNTFLDGAKTTLRKKGSQIHKTDNLPTMVLSNYDPAHAWKSEDVIQKVGTIYARCTVVEINQQIDLDNIQVTLPSSGGVYFNLQDPSEIASFVAASLSSQHEAQIPSTPPSTQIVDLTIEDNEKEEDLSEASSQILNHPLKKVKRNVPFQFPSNFLSVSDSDEENDC